MCKSFKKIDRNNATYVEENRRKSLNWINQSPRKLVANYSIEINALQVR